MSAFRRSQEPTLDNKNIKTRAKKLIAITVMGGAAVLGSACSAEEQPMNVPTFSPVANGEAVPGQGTEGQQQTDPEYIARQHRIDQAMPYLKKDNEQNRENFINDLDSVSSLKGANYFQGRGEKLNASVDMTADEALAWVQLQVYKADRAAQSGDFIAADAIAAAVTEGKEHDAVVQAFGTSQPNVGSAIVTPDAPVFEVNNSGSIHVGPSTYSISEPGSKMYAFTSVTTETLEPIQQVLRFTPSSDNKDGAWSLLTTRDPGTITSADISQY